MLEVLKGKKILLGVTGSIAAYKSALIVREFKKLGASVKVIMTIDAQEFITPLTLSTLSEEPVLSNFKKDNTGVWNSHVELGLWADIMIIAPASANTIGKMANGICDNLLLATYLSARCPVFVCPAMDLDMYKHPAVWSNLSLLKTFGNYIIEAEHGELASGLIGQGRLAEPEKILLQVANNFTLNKFWKGKKIVITAGPTREAIDPVRYISNHSTGKMGYAIAEYAAALGADVTLVSGPTNLTINQQNITHISVNSAAEMYAETIKIVPNANYVILSAAVADYTPKHVSNVKIKKKEAEFSIDLTKTTDIAYQVGQIKKDQQIVVGFALETNNELENAKNKLVSKKFDLIVLNSLQDTGAGFGHDTNKITILDKNNNQFEFPLKSKRELAKDLFDILEKV